MHAQSLDRLNEVLRGRGLNSALLSSPFTLTWLTGYAPPIQTGPSPFEGGPALAWWQEGQVTLLVSDAEEAAARATGVGVRSYIAYTIDRPLAGPDDQATALRELLSETGRGKGKVGVELDFLPAGLAAIFHAVLPSMEPARLDGAFDIARAVKSPEELLKIRAAIGICDRGQLELHSRMAAGVTELHLWGMAKAAMESAAGSRLPVLTDLVAGTRTADIGGLPGAYALKTGDPLIFDVVPRLDGYWGDNAATFFLGAPSPDLAKAYTVARDTLRRAVDRVRPGLVASELDGQMRASIRDQGYPVYPHHSGHGIGASYHEEPRIVPYNGHKLEPGMVIALEPGIYLSGVGGVRLEDVVLVTADGCELLTTHLLDR